MENDDFRENIKGGVAHVVDYWIHIIVDICLFWSQNDAYCRETRCMNWTYRLHTDSIS